MKILYAIQGTGNGHLARAEDIVPVLQKHGDLDIFVSGAQADLELPFNVNYKSKGLSFYFGKRGGVNITKTIEKNNTREIYREIRSFPIAKYDLVINDFEPISAWAARRNKIPCVGLSHQASLWSPKVPQPAHSDPVGRWILKHYAPVDHHVGFHFASFDDNIFTPVVRRRIRRAQQKSGDHYTVYLPAYDDLKLVPLLLEFPGIKWHIFSKHTRVPYHVAKISVFPVDNEAFTQSMASSKGILCGAGFETPAEALFLKKKLLVVPMKKQYEQHFNASALKQMGVSVLNKIKKKTLPALREWIENDRIVEVAYEDITDRAVTQAISLR